MGSKITYEERTGANACKMYYAYDNAGKLYGFYYDGASNDGFYFYKRNLQGDIIGILNNSGTEVVTYLYDAWGKLVSTTGTLASTVGADNPFRYRGYYYDDETSLYYLNQRYYNPEWRRFINADDFGGVTGGLLSHNIFAYCLNNPVMNADSSGRFATLFGTLIGGIVGAVSAAVRGEDIVAGAIGGAVQGAIFGAAVDITVATGGAGIGVFIAAGAVAGMAGNATKQVVEGCRQGQSFGESISNIDTMEVGIAGLIGGVSGGLSYGAMGASNAASDFAKSMMDDVLAVHGPGPLHNEMVSFVGVTNVVNKTMGGIFNVLMPFVEDGTNYAIGRIRELLK